MLRPKIYDLFSQEFSDKYTKGDDVTISDDYIEWKHDCNSLPKLLNKGSEHSMVTMNINLLQNHWVFFVGIDFYNSNDDKKITMTYRFITSILPIRQHGQH